MLSFVLLPMLILICHIEAQSSNNCSFGATVTINSQADATSLASCPYVSSTVLVSSEFEGPLILDGMQQIWQLLCESVGSITSLESSTLFFIEDTWTLSNLSEITNISLPMLNYTASVNFTNLPALNEIKLANSVETWKNSQLTISNTNLTSIPNFTDRYRTVEIHGNSQLNNVALWIHDCDSFNISFNGPTLNLDLPVFGSVEYDLVIQNCSSINLPSLEYSGRSGNLGRLLLSGNQFSSFSLNKLYKTSIQGGLSIVDNEQLTSFSLPALYDVGSLQIAGNPLLQEINLPVLTYIESNASLSGSFSSISWPNFTYDNGAMNISTTNTLQQPCSSLNKTQLKYNSSNIFTCKALNTTSSAYSFDAKYGLGGFVPICVLLIMAALLLL